MTTPENIGILGTGLMGKGIAESIATAGLRATLIKVTAGDSAAIQNQLAASFQRSVERGKLTREAADEILGRIVVSDDRDRLAGCDMVIESVVEDLATKQALLDDVEGRLPNHVILGTNTSSLRVSDIGARLRVPGRFLGTHFFSPVPAMKLVELAPTRETAPFAMEKARELTVAIGKTPVIVTDSSGYIVNRLLVPYLLDAVLTLESGVSSAEDIDRAMQLGCGHPMGPLALADFIGLDVVYAMARTLYINLQDRRYSPPALLRRLVLRGQLGKKSGAGIYDYSTKPPRENPSLRLLPEGEEHHMH
ncbi:MAG TPA: 3-hydroxyacyl-CoA dehydrogenase family protein [Polyangia bacterium]|jgi:3-hydroxybutyryl-CoA dehydrogenase|nr:3-hydroxyacyl-CoA dehydrogenase family protein [Polyangia bacterium]